MQWALVVLLLSLLTLAGSFTVRPGLLQSSPRLFFVPLKSSVSAPTGSSPAAAAADAAAADPHMEAKVDRLDASALFIEQLSNRLVDLVDEDEPEKSLQHALEVCLFADGVDEISSKAGQSVREKRVAFFEGLSSKRDQIIPDGSSAINAVVEALTTTGKGGEKLVSIMVGDCGSSLIGDLLLAHVLISLQLASRVTLIASTPKQKQDSRSPSLRATAVDVAGHIEHLADPKLHRDVWAVRHFGEACRMHAQSGQITFAEGDEDMPTSVLAGSMMVFVKGEANYRRLLGEREWPLDTPARDVLSYWPVPVCALRCVRAEIGCGISEATQARLEREDVSWMLRGRHYQVHYAPRL